MRQYMKCPVFSRNRELVGLVGRTKSSTTGAGVSGPKPIEETDMQVQLALEVIAANDVLVRAGAGAGQEVDDKPLAAA